MARMLARPFSRKRGNPRKLWSLWVSAGFALWLFGGWCLAAVGRRLFPWRAYGLFGRLGAHRSARDTLFGRGKPAFAAAFFVSALLLAQSYFERLLNCGGFC